MLEVHRGGQHQLLHRENAIYQPFIEQFSQTREFLASVNWAGTDFTLKNGATRLVPGSHEWPEDRIAKESEIAQAVMTKGSVVVWLSRTLHGAGASTSTEGRTAFFGSYVADWLQQEENQYLAVPPEAAERLSDRAQQLIGYQCSDALGWVKGRSRENLLRPGTSGSL
jgi:ectoine hydroxylase-related dioxygenase (phytanoyl-CoA dioxygenase family)